MNEGNVADDKRVTAVVTFMGYRRTTLRECPTLKTITRMIVFYGTKIRGNPGNYAWGKQRNCACMEREREREREKGVTYCQKEKNGCIWGQLTWLNQGTWK